MSGEQSIAEILHNFDVLQLPIGVYFVAPDGQFLACNRPVRQMLGLPLEGMVEASIADFYADPSRRPELLTKAVQAEGKDWHLEKEIAHFKVQGRDLYVQMNCKPLRDPSTREIVGYAGCLVDVTAEHGAKQREDELQHKVDELVLDIGRILHANSSTLLMVKQTLDAVAEALRSNSFKELIPPLPDEWEGTLTEQADRLVGAVERLLQVGDPDRRLKALPELKWEMLSAQISTLRHFQERVRVPEMRPPTLRKVAHEILEICQEIQVGLLPREPIRDVLRASTQLERLTSLIAVLNTRTAVIQMDFTLRALREYVTSDERGPEEKKRLPVKQLIQEAITQLAEFAKTSKVEIVWHDQDREAEVIGSERDLVRALSNLLHNAIKYTWTRDRTKLPWVTIRTKHHDRQICIEFENWGVPISQTELEEELIFRLGYRGKWSTDRGRLGTGIGLTDARRVARAHSGEVYVNSKPARATSLHPEDEEYYKQPFVTKISFCLPLARSR